MAKPKLRFPEFTDEWKEYKISEIFDRIANPVAVEKDKCYRQIGIRSHGKGLFYKEEVTGEELGDKRVFWIEPDCFVVNIVFAWERAVAKLTDAERGMIASHRFPMYKPKEKVLDLDYITEYFITFYGQKILILASPGGAGRNKTLGQDEFFKSKIKLPSYTEQKKIVVFLFVLGDFIQIQEEEISALEEQKKGMMQKLFNREVRFKADDGREYPEWGKQNLESIAIIKMGQSPDSSSYNDECIGLPLIQGNADMAGRESAPQRYTSTPTKECNIGDIIMTVRAPVGFVGKSIHHACIGRGVCAISSKINAEFLFQFLISVEESWKHIEQGSTFTAIGGDEVKKLLVYIPCAEEQQKIADCLSVYDEIIQIKKDKLEAWKEIKKGLLQQMFV